MRVDAHQHFWKFDPVRDTWITAEMMQIRRDFMPSDLQSHLEKHKLHLSVAVQADQTETETNFLLAFAREFDFIGGVVGWVDLKSPQLEERLEYYSQFEKLKGFRHIVQAEPPGFLADQSFVEGVKLLHQHKFSYDLLVYHHQLPEAITFVRQLPEVNIILDHIAKPNIKSKEISHWNKHMAAIAECENVSCKISGMVTEDDWTGWQETDFHPYLDSVMEHFGAHRLLYGSDWPVCLVAATYEQQLSIVENYFSKLSDSERDSIMGINSKRIYRL